MKKLADTDFKTFYDVNEYVAKTTPMRTHYASKNPIERWLWQGKKRVIKHMVSGLSYKNVLDVGCGDGGLLQTVKREAQYTGVDISPTQLVAFRRFLPAARKKYVRLVQSDITKLPFPDHSFDLAFACDVLEHVLEPEKVLREIRRVVKKYGFVIFSIPNESLLQLARLMTLRFPLRSPDHLYSLGVSDVVKQFPKVISFHGIPVRFSAALSLINILLVQNSPYA